MNNYKEKRLLAFFALLFSFLFLLRGNITASPWDDYAKFMNRFYQLDRQDFKVITCRIEVPLLEQMVSEAKNKLKPYENQMKVVETIPEFLFTIEKSGKSHFNKPFFNIDIISDEGIGNIKKVKSGIKTLKERVRSIVENVMQIVDAVFENYKSPDKSVYEVREISHVGGRTKTVYKKGGLEYVRIYTDNECIETAADPLESAQSRIAYTNMNDKLLYSKAQVDLKLIDKEISVGLSVNYQNLGQIIFPDKIIGIKIINAHEKKESLPINIFLKDCKVFLTE